MQFHDKKILAIAFALLATSTGCAAELETDDAEPIDEYESDGSEEDRTYEGWLGSALGSPVVTGTTMGKSNEFGPNCTLSLASDVSYTWTAPSTGEFTFTTAGSSFDTALHIRSFVDSSQTLGCSDNADGTAQSSVSLQLTAGTTVIIVVDGRGKARGAFELNISEDDGFDCVDDCSIPPNECLLPGTCVHDPVGGPDYCHYPIPWIDGGPCDDGNACTPVSTCYGGSCVAESFGCHDAPNDCYEPIGTCIDPALGTCEYTPKAAGSACSDGLGCTIGDSCNGAGTCNSGPSNCPPGELCSPAGVCIDEPGGCPGVLEDCGSAGCCAPGTNCMLCLAEAI